MYGLIVPPGVPAAVAEALEGEHHNPDVDEMQTRMYLLEHQYDVSEELLVLMPNLAQKVEYVSTGERAEWTRLGEQHGRQ